MEMDFTRQEKIAHINRSPESVAVHDKEKWLGIFSQNAVIEDPVGSSPHYRHQLDATTGENALSRFYETFIAPNNIRFRVNDDIVCEDHVVRDLTIDIDMGATSVSVPMHLLYELCSEKGQLKISRLAAHWELLPMIGVLMSSGRKALPVLSSLTKRMLRHQGMKGALGFASGIGILGGQRKAKIAHFFDCLNRHDSQRLLLYFAANAKIHAPFGEAAISPIILLQKMNGSFSYEKLIVAGYVVTANFSFQSSDNTTAKKGVAVFEFQKNSLLIEQLTFYYE